MRLALEKGVHVYNGGVIGDHIGTPGTRTNFKVGAYGLSNPYSANMFSYLFRTYDFPVAKNATETFEKKLVQSAAKYMWQLLELDWDSIFRLRGIVDVQGTITGLAVTAGGWAFNQVRLSGALSDWNPNSPSDLGDADAYALYAIAYWGKNPTVGPAYRVLQK